VRVLVSDDGGDTFRFLAFNVPGALDNFAFPNVVPGVFNQCNGLDIENVLHQGPYVINSISGLRQYTQTTRLIHQPAAGANRGRFVFALNSSTSPIIGDPNAIKATRITGDIPQNVNFASIKGSEIISFLNQSNIAPVVSTGSARLATEAIAASAASFTVRIVCRE
jgi:hypothetical protein